MLGRIEFANRDRSVAVLVITLAVLAFSALRLQVQNTGITGVVKNASGQPVEGALVRVRSADLGLTFMVVSQAQGLYRTPNLLPGNYTIEAIGGDYQSNAAETVEVRSRKQEKLDLQLSTVRKPTSSRKRMTQAEHAARMPDGPAKELILTKCVVCHSLDGALDTRTLRVEASRRQWEEVIGTHKYYMEDLPQALSLEEVDTIVDYMTKHFSQEAATSAFRREPGARPDPNSHLPMTLLQGAEAKYVVMEFNLRAGAFPHDISVDSNGIAWIAEHGENEAGVNEHGVHGIIKEGVGLISRFDPESLKYTHFAPPAGKFPSRISGAAVDPQNIVWTVDNSHNARMISYNPKTGEFKTYPMPAPPRLKDFDEFGFGDGSANMNTLTFQDGFVWGSGLLSGQVYKLDPVSGGVITYPFPKGKPPYGLAFDKNKILWSSLEFADEIVKLDTTTGKLTHYKVPTPKADLRHIQTDADGNVWASAQQSGKLIKIDAGTGQVTEYAPPTLLSGINSVDVDTKHNVIWVAEAEVDKMARFDPRTNTFTEFALPSSRTGLKRIAVDPSNPDRVWWCATGSNRAGYVEVIE
jgi:streptogramin lyase